jgi:hypothetical protein
LCSARGTTVPMITCSTSSAAKTFKFEQLVQPDGIFIRGRRGSVAIRQRS